MKHTTDTNFNLNPFCFKVVLITALILTVLKPENFCLSCTISNESLTYYSVLPITSGMICRNHCQPKAEYSDFKIIQIPAFHSLDCERNVSIMQMANRRLPAMVTRSKHPNLCGCHKMAWFPKARTKHASPRAPRLCCYFCSGYHQ